MGPARSTMAAITADMRGRHHLNMLRMTSVRPLLSSSPIYTDISILETVIIPEGMAQNSPRKEFTVANAERPADPGRHVE